MSSYDKVCERWVAIERGERPGNGWYLRNWRMPSEPGAIYSYGRHFPLAETLRDSRGKVRTFLLNGDRSTATTMGKHQPAIRRACQQSGIPTIVIPFSALRASGIDRSTIRPIDVREDRTETIIEPVESIDVDAIVWGKTRDHGYNGRGGAVSQEGRIPGRSDVHFTRHLRGYDYAQGCFVDYDNPEPSCYTESGSRVEHDNENGWHVKRYRHWLGDSVFRAKVGRGWRTFVSSFDYQERRPLYFLAELPRGAKVSTVEDAILALSPRIVHAAVAQGRDVKRQGDMFAIPTTLTTRDVKARCGRTIERMQGVFATDHVVTERVTGKGGVTYARGTIHHRPGGTPDHRRVKLGDVWHLIVPNAVPRRRAAGMVRVAR